MNLHLMQRARGEVRLAVSKSGAAQRLDDLYQSGCYKVMLPRTHTPIPDAVFINTAGGLTGGDYLKAHISIGSQARQRVATQTAERIYRSNAGCAQVALSFNLSAGSECDWLAQETILFDGGRIKRQITADLAEDASALFVEPLVLGRLSMGEDVRSGRFEDHWRITQSGKLLFADSVCIEDFEALQAPAAMGAARAMATVLLVDPSAEAIAARLVPQDFGDHVEHGLSCWNGMLLIRMLARNPLDLTNALGRVVERIRGRRLPRVWTM